MKSKGKLASATLVSEAPAEPVKRPTGRPPKGARAMSHAERQTAYRTRQRTAALAAYGHPQGQPAPAILAALSRLLAQLDDPDRAKDHDTLRDMAQDAVRELCARYRLNISSR